jgi:predicted secreted protein
LPDVLREVLVHDITTVEVGSGDAAERVRDLLAAEGAARITGSAHEADAVSRLLVDLVTRPIETEFLRLHPRVAEVERTAEGGTVVSLELAEVAP